MGWASRLNNKRSTDNPTRSQSDELHLTGLEIAQILTMLPDKVARTRFINNYHLEPLPEIPKYIQLPYGDPKTHKPYTLFQAINDRIMERHDTEEYEIIPIETSIKTFLNTHKFTSDLKIGQYSATNVKDKVRYVTQIPYTITECAREYIRICEFLSGNRLKPKYSKHKDRVHTSPTHYYSGYYAGDLAYIDLSAAYWSILWPTTMDMEYDPVRQEIAAEGNIRYWHCDQFAKCKPIRQIIHSLFNYRTMRVWKWDEGRIRHQFPPSELYRPYNLWYIYDVMNAIVNDVKKNFTLLQWLTDAAIVPAHQAIPLQNFLFEEWFLDSRLVALGPGVSNQTNMYKVGIKQTAHFDSKIRGRPYDVLRPANIESLKEIRQQAKNGTLPEIAKSKRKPKMWGFSLEVIEESEFKPRQKIIAPKRNYNPMSGRKNSPPPENTIDVSEFLKKKNK